MSATKYSLNILVAEGVHLLSGIGFGLVPWGWLPGVIYVMWKELYRDVKANYGDRGIHWLWNVPVSLYCSDGIYRPTEYRWGPGPAGAIAYQKKAWLDMVMYFAGMALGIGWQPW